MMMIRRVSLPLGFVAEFHFNLATKHFSTQWKPDVPKTKDPRQRRKFTAAHAAARDAYLQEAANN